MKFDIKEELNVVLSSLSTEFHWLPIQNGGIVRVYIYMYIYTCNYFAGKEFCKLGHNNYT